MSHDPSVPTPAPLGRRDFLGVSAGLAAGLFAAGSATAADEPAPLRVAIMGLGGRGRAHAATFAKQPGVTVAALCEPDADRLAAAAAEVAQATGAAPQTEKDVRKLLDDDSIDALVIAAPNHWHAPATLLACAAGKHVYVEKPCSHNPAEGEMMIAAARKHSRCVQVGTQRRSGPAIREGIELVRGGAIGKPYYARTWYANRRGPIGHAEASSPPKDLDYDLWQGPAPRTPYHANYLPYTWHWFWNWGNGELGNNGPHALDLARWALGVDYPNRATSSGGRYAYQDDQQTPDTQVASFEFDGGRQIMWEGLSCNSRGIDGEGFGATIHGDRGTLVLSSGGYQLLDDRRKEVEKNTGSVGDAEHVANFLAAVRANDPALLNCDAETGHKSTLLAHLGNIAQRVGRSIRCDPANGHVVGDADAAKLWSREYASGWEPKV